MKGRDERKGSRKQTKEKRNRGKTSREKINKERK